MAHSGVQQPDLWNWWVEPYKDKIKFRVFCNPEHVERQKDFLKAGTENRLLPFHMETGWAKISLVEAQFRGYKFILEEFGYKKVRMIYLVSGFDIPVMSPKKLLEMPKISRVPVLDVLKFKNPEGKKYTFLRSVQWIHLTGRLANKLANTPTETIHFVARNLDLYNQNHSTEVYDEIVPATILRALGILFGKDCDSKLCCADDTLTDFERHKNSDPSPVEWDTLDTKKKIATEKGFRKRSLRQIMIEDKEQEFVFFRKVKASVDFSGEFLREFYSFKS